MTGRIRTIKPEWLDDELLASAPDEARVLSVALILMADDHGRGRGSVPEIAMAAWRYEMSREDGANASATLAKASRALSALVEMRFVKLYRVAGQTYFEIRTWPTHQKVDHKGKPRVPAPPAEESVTTTALASPSRDSREDTSSPSRDARARSGPPTSDLRPPTETTTGAHASAPSGVDPLEWLVCQLYAAAHKTKTDTAWMHLDDVAEALRGTGLRIHAKVRDQARSLAGWCRAQDDAEAAAVVLIERWFLDQYAERASWSFALLASNPGRVMASGPILPPSKHSPQKALRAEDFDA